MMKFLEIGLSGWIVSIVMLLISGGLGIFFVHRRKARQSNIISGGDVAGGDIIKGISKKREGITSSSEINSVQKNIVASGDVAGGNIDKRDR